MKHHMNQQNILLILLRIHLMEIIDDTREDFACSYFIGERM